MENEARWITIDGRRWRASDSAIPPTLRKELVDELMKARRAVAAAKRSSGVDGLRHARRHVHAAKIALGERGAPWWEATDDNLRTRAEAIIEVLARHRAPESTICPSDAARVLGGPSWRRHMDLVRQVAADMADRHLIDVTQRGESVAGRDWRGPVRIRSRDL
jgi:hypothetical protein